MPQKLKKTLRFLLIFVGLFLVFDLLFPFKINPDYSTIIVDNKGQVLSAYLNRQDKWRLKTELPELTPQLKKAYLYKEDRWFYFHPGFNPVAILRALVKNIIRGKRTSGASTITMQVVRLLEPNERTYFRKIIEIMRAMQLELHYSKDEILQCYVNLVPFGSNIEGLKSASVIYFQKTPDRLSLAEVTTLMLIPNRPNSFKLGPKNDYIKRQRNQWLKRLLDDEEIDLKTYESAIYEPLTAVRNAIPKLSPHLSYRLKTQYPDLNRIETTIDLRQQRLVEDITKNNVNRLRVQNITNAAVIVLDNERNEVVAYAGSSDFANAEAEGQVDGVRALRSPGSTLKPLLYALAFDLGIATPRSIINDVPSNFGGYEPENFDQDFHGKISITYALANSLNIPAVKILDQMGKESLVEALKKANFQHVKKNSKQLGLSMILGGCSVTLEELSNLFASFARNGEYQQASFLKSNRSIKAKTQLFSPEASFLINDILTQITRPDLPNNYAYTFRTPKIAWKTGTSFGKKDAWSIGYNKKYTIGVWVGNFSGEGVPELSGANIATPLLFELFNAIDYNTTAKWFSATKVLSKRFICAESGDLPNHFCQNQVFDYFIPGVSHTHTCEHLREVQVSTDGRFSYCTRCLPNEGFKTVQLENNAPELVGFYESKHLNYQKIPPHNPACERIFDDHPPTITFPVNAATYFVNATDKQPLLLSCQTSTDVKEVFWYVNDRFLRKANVLEAVPYKPDFGKIKISCTDDKGRTTNVSVRIKAE